MYPDVVRLLITGASTEAAYNIVYQIGLTNLFSPKRLIIVLFDFLRFQKHILEVAAIFRACQLPHLHDIQATCDELEAFSNIHYALLLNTGQDMTRAKGPQDMILESVNLYRHYGRFLSAYSPRDCKVVVSGCQANINAHFCRHNATNIPPRNFSTVLALSGNRAAAQIGLEIKTLPWKIKNVIVWGNSCYTQFCDVKFATFDDKKVSKYATEHWRRHCLPRMVQKRSINVMTHRCMSPVMSVANSVVKHLTCLHQGTPPSEWISMGVVSDGSYGIDEGIIFGFPVRVEDGRWTIVPDLQVDDFTEENIGISLRSFKNTINMVMAAFRHSSDSQH